jgi:hypothetical protein
MTVDDWLGVLAWGVVSYVVVEAQKWLSRRRTSSG